MNHNAEILKTRFTKSVINSKVSVMIHFWYFKFFVLLINNFLDTFEKVRFYKIKNFQC